MKPHPVAVTWRDAADIGPAEWLVPEVLDDAAVSPETIVTVGWLLSRDRKQVVLALSISASGLVRGVFSIPRACVVEVVKLGPVA